MVFAQNHDQAPFVVKSRKRRADSARQLDGPRRSPLRELKVEINVAFDRQVVPVLAILVVVAA